MMFEISYMGAWLKDDIFLEMILWGYLGDVYDFMLYAGPLSLSEMLKNARKHGVKPDLIGNKLPYKKTYSWVFSQVKRLKNRTPWAPLFGSI
jgi:hypothetical protein